ncbi:prostaglandin E2 receptor EP4 subtype-like [Ostrea edulis]|uniref:prostaglandin E2 receptor EP4 subtype-like n=1 Tax=Ostrea edulis TaxID=37623 RepID=UPI0024AF48A2|nr:prostaglandin E2 receptor EP4 subtype-like [Ostrea edulis]
MMVNGTCVNTPTVPLNGTFAASLTGLFSLIAIIWLSQSMYKQRQFSKPKFLSIAVCFTDLMFAVVIIIIVVIYFFVLGISNSLLLASRWLGYCAMGGDTGCTIRGFCRSSIMVTAQMMVLFMTIERYIALRFPFRYQQLLPPRRILITTFSIYVYSILLSTLPFMGVNSYGYDYWCDFHWNDTSPAGRSFVFYILLQGTGCMLFTIFCNISVIYEVLAIKRRVDLANRKQSFKEEVEHIKFIIIMGLVSVLYIICTAPYLVCLIKIKTCISFYAS